MVDSLWQRGRHSDNNGVKICVLPHLKLLLLELLFGARVLPSSSHPVPTALAQRKVVLKGQVGWCFVVLILMLGGGRGGWAEGFYAGRETHTQLRRFKTLYCWLTLYWQTDRQACMQTCMGVCACAHTHTHTHTYIHIHSKSTLVNNVHTYRAREWERERERERERELVYWMLLN